MVKDSFFLISTGSLNAYPENTRSSFKNVLPKTARVNAVQNELYISLDQLNFEQSYNFYRKQPAPAFQYVHKTVENPKGVAYKCVIDKNIYTIDSLLTFVNNAVKKAPVIFLKVEKDKLNHNYITLEVKKGHLIEFSNYFWSFLKLSNAKIHLNLPDAKIITEGIYKSYSPVNLLEYFPDYIDVYCEDVDEYSSNSSQTKVIASIPLDKNYFGGSIHHDSENNHYFRLSRDNINSLSIELRHPNGSQLYLSRGPPTIVKLNIKEMNPINDFFYVQVSSNQSVNHPSNTIAKFHTTLPREFILDGEWKVAMTNLHLPSNDLPIFKNDYRVYNHPDEDDRRILFVKHVLNPVDPLSRFTEGVDNPHEFIFPNENFTRYEFMKELKKDFSDVLNIEVDSEENFIISTKKVQGEDIKIHFYITPKLSEVIFKNFDRSNIGGFTLPIYDELPLKLQSAILRYKTPDRLHKASFIPIEYRKKYEGQNIFDRINFDLYYEENEEDTAEEKEDAKKAKAQNKKSRKEVQKILETLAFEEKDERSKFDLREINPAWMFIYADFVAPTIIGENYSNLLKLIPYKNGVKSGGFYSFSSLDFFNVNKTSIKTLEIIIKTHSGSDFKFFTNNHASMTLMFKKSF